VVVLSSCLDEKNHIPDTSRDAEFAKRLFGDSNEEEEVCEEDAADAKAAPSSAMKSSAPTASTADANDADKGQSPDQVIGNSSSSGDKAGSP
jgi:hypothetical protein